LFQALHDLLHHALEVLHSLFHVSATVIRRATRHSGETRRANARARATRQT
jgi:hypothetical protein